MNKPKPLYYADYIQLERGKVQDRILAELCNGIQRVEDMEWDRAERLIRAELNQMEVIEAVTQRE